MGFIVFVFKDPLWPIDDTWASRMVTKSDWFPHTNRLVSSHKH